MEKGPSLGKERPGWKTWVRRRLNWLWQGCTRLLPPDLQQQVRRYRGVRRESPAKLHKYMADNEFEMRYDVFRASGGRPKIFVFWAIFGNFLHFFGVFWRKVGADWRKVRGFWGESGRFWRVLGGV